MAFHSGLTVHMAKPNMTDDDRAVHTMIMFADGCTRGSQAMSTSRSTATAIEVGAAIRGAGTPILWPRADGDYPAPPPPFPEAVHHVAPIGLLPAARQG